MRLNEVKPSKQLRTTVAKCFWDYNYVCVRFQVLGKIELIGSLRFDDRELKQTQHRRKRERYLEI